MKDNQAKYPQLRFKGFTDPWVQRELSDIAEVRTGKAFSSSDFTDDGEFRVVTNKNIQDKTTGKIFTGDRINVSDQTVIDKYVLSGENILVTMDGANIGKVGMYTDSGALLAQRVGRLNSSVLNFVYQIVSDEKFISRMNQLAVGNAIKHISLEQIGRYEIAVPESETEKTKIGQLLSNLDNLIAANQRKLDLLKEQKKGYLQKMFPKNGAKVPELRFAGFADAWEQRKLKDTLSLIKDGTHGTHKDGNFSMLLSTKNLINGKVVFNKSKDRKIGKKDYDSIFKGYSIHEKDVLLSVVGSIGRLALYYPQDIPIAFQRSVAILRGNKSLEQEFLKYVLETHDAQRQLKMRTTMSAQPDLFLGDLSQVMIKVPIFKEQIKIIKIFDSISNLIASNQRKLEKLQELKKGYLQKMFC